MALNSFFRKVKYRTHLKITLATDSCYDKVPQNIIIYYVESNTVVYFTEYLLGSVEK